MRLSANNARNVVFFDDRYFTAKIHDVFHLTVGGFHFVTITDKTIQPATAKQKPLELLPKTTNPHLSSFPAAFGKQQQK